MAMKSFWKSILLYLGLPAASYAQFYSNFTETGGLTTRSFTNQPSLEIQKTRWQASFFSIQAEVLANTAAMRVSNLRNINANFLRQNVLGTSELSSGQSRINLRGPSLAFRLNPKLSMAIGTSTRFHTNYENVDGRLLSEIGEIVKVPQQYPYVMSKESMHMNAAVFSEINLSTSYLLFKNSVHSITGGLSLKYINGIANSAINVKELTGTIRRINSYLTALNDATGGVTTRTSGTLFGDLNTNNLFKLNKASFGASFGLQYIYYGEGKEAKFTVGFSVSDIGTIRYKADSTYSKSYNVEISNGYGLYFNNNFNNSTFSQTTKVFDKYPDFFSKTSSSSQTYALGLPTTLNIWSDYKFDQHFYTRLTAIVNLRQKDAAAMTLYGNSLICLSPRWEKGKFGISLPVMFRSISGLNAGLEARVGQLILGSNSIFNSAIGKSKQLDFFIGISFPQK
ncbi:MAG: DUF5723 family protein [Dyadobacter sp.]|uniref:DUF5723 family protein n=1 Tax=Dyadobacter sp. TaxID=1914288 RepID=UPI003267C401